VRSSATLLPDIDGRGVRERLRKPGRQGSVSGPTGTEAFQQGPAGCAAGLKHRWKGPHHIWIHASDLFTSAPAAEDLASVIRALGLGKIDLYGDSYGSFFVPRYPQLFNMHASPAVRARWRS
jgi:pimeloyl-ACP methyl ester carboxylesterase